MELLTPSIECIVLRTHLLRSTIDIPQFYSESMSAAYCSRVMT
jgi:hypothetical protein